MIAAFAFWIKLNAMVACVFPQIHVSKLLLFILMIFVDTDFRGVHMDGSDP